MKYQKIWKLNENKYIQFDHLFQKYDFCKIKEDEVFQLYGKQRWIILNNDFDDFEKMEKYFQ